MTEDALALRPCRQQDVEHVLDLWARAGAVPRPTDHREALEVRLKRDSNLFLLAWDGDALVGSLMGGWDGWRGAGYEPDASVRRSAKNLGEEA